MATFNKPGVYIQEVLSPNLPVTNLSGASVGAFIGIADRGPTTTVGGNVVGVPTLVSSWDEFVNKFSFGAVTNIFSSDIFGATPNANFLGTATADLKYAMYTFFANGGTNAYVTRKVNNGADKASVTVADNQGTVAVTASSNTLTYTVATNQITIAGNAGTWAGISTGDVISISGVNSTGTGSTDVNTLIAPANSFVVVSATGTTLTLAHKRTSAISGSPTQSTGTVTVTGIPSNNTSAALVISANSHGAWGNNLWVGITPNQTPNYFDLTVYYGTDATITASTATATNLSANNIVETIPQLSLNPSDARFVTNVVNSNWITVSINPGTPNNPTTRLPEFTSVWSTNTANATGSTAGTFKWSANGIGTGITAVRLGGYGVTLSYSPSSTTSAAIATSTAGTIFGTTTSFVARNVGVSGTSGTGDPTTTLQQLDAVSNQLIINYPGAFDATTVAKVTDYAAGRGDSFAVIDPGTTYTTVSTLTTALDNLTLSNPNFGAVYFPNLTYSDPGSTVLGATKTIAPGGAVVATYCSVDTNQGAFRSPAGTAFAINGAIPTTSLSNDDFNTVSAALRNVNIIRNVPGYGTCIMGARSIASSFSDKFISVRRALNYIEYTLKNITQFAIFEPNDQNLWNDIIGIVGGFLNDYWTKGGLAGATADQAFYVKCDSTINTPTTLAAGELRIEVGVALQRPAEFVVIKIGQINGGTTVTTTI